MTRPGADPSRPSSSQPPRSAAASGSIRADFERDVDERFDDVDEPSIALAIADEDADPTPRDEPGETCFVRNVVQQWCERRRICRRRRLSLSAAAAVGLGVILLLSTWMTATTAPIAAPGSIAGDSPAASHENLTFTAGLGGREPVSILVSKVSQLADLSTNTFTSRAIWNAANLDQRDAGRTSPSFAFDAPAAPRWLFARPVVTPFDRWTSPMPAAPAGSAAPDQMQLLPALLKATDLAGWRQYLWPDADHQPMYAATSR